MMRRYFDDGLAQASFLLACDRTREAVVIDPRRDVDVYVAAARQQGLRLTTAIETHLHADFVSGARELSALGVRVIGGPGCALRFEHHEAAHGEPLPIGDLALRLLHTPGHTPEHICIIADHPDEPPRVFTGDTLLVGAVGRPEPTGADDIRELAARLYDSLFDQLLALDDRTEVHPGHGAGWPSGVGIGSEPHSTIGQERRFNPMLQHRSRDTFVTAVLGDRFDRPPYFARLKRTNQDGPAVLGLSDGLTNLPSISADSAAAAANGGAVLLDVRPPEAFGAGHPTGAINIGFGAKLGYWAGCVLPAGVRVVVVAACARDASDTARQLLRVGFDRVDGCVVGGFEAWQAAGLPVARIPQMTAAALRAKLAAGEPIAVLDVRSPREWRTDHIDAALHVPIGDLPASLAAVPTAVPVATLCDGGGRSSLAASLLSRAGLVHVVNVIDGMAGYLATDTTRDVHRE